MRRLTQTEFVIFLSEWVDVHFNGNQTAAAADMGEERTTLNQVLSGNKPPTKKIVDALGMEIKKVNFYVRKRK